MKLLFASYVKMEFVHLTPSVWMCGECWFCGPFYFACVLTGVHILTISQIIKTFVFSIFCQAKNIEEIKAELKSFDEF